MNKFKCGECGAIRHEVDNVVAVKCLECNSQKCYGPLKSKTEPVAEVPCSVGLSVKQFEELLKEFAGTHFDCGEWRDDEDTEDLRKLVEKGKGIKAKLLEAFKNR
ncbi:hypothetical protein KAR91_52545 [Candidatus Pacearchaeota archaeon]|nr:hypothetical protein [Candidatus Pacearchaeota archaeon]